MLDAQRRIFDLNGAAEKYTGLTTSSLGRPVEEVVAWWNDAVAEDRPKSGASRRSSRWSRARAISK